MADISPERGIAEGGQRRLIAGRDESGDGTPVGEGIGAALAGAHDKAIGNFGMPLAFCGYRQCASRCTSHTDDTRHGTKQIQAGGTLRARKKIAEQTTNNCSLQARKGCRRPLWPSGR
jgi:hypothetical protein